MTDAASDALRRELDALPPSVLQRLHAAAFDPARLVILARHLLRGSGVGGASAARAARNRVAGPVRGPNPGEVLSPPEPGSPDHARLTARGLQAVARGELAFCVMAGGMATRMGGVIKALVEVVGGRTFLDLRLEENGAWSRRAGRPMPLWLMTSEATDEGIRQALAVKSASGGSLDHVRTFPQDLSVRLTAEGRVFRGDDGQPSTYGTGHGDLVDALRRSGLLDEFRAQGGRWVWIANVDNLGATVDPCLLGMLLEQGDTRRAELLVEVAPKAPGDRGGIPVFTGGRLQVLEEFRLPEGFDGDTVRVFNTNTFLVSADALALAPLTWTFFEVEKKVDGRVAVQFERLLQELTAHLQTVYVQVPRDGAVSRFLPVKDHDELARRRPALEALLRARADA